MVNFMYPAGDGRLKTLNCVINNQAYRDAILTCGERVDGSSLFPFIEAGSSDLYVIPRFRTAFLADDVGGGRVPYTAGNSAHPAWRSGAGRTDSASRSARTAHALSLIHILLL